MVGQPSYLGVAPGDWVAALRSSDPLEQRLAAHALAEIGPAAGEAVPALIEALRDPESFVRVWVGAALARIQPENPDAIAALVAGMRDGISFVRSLSAWHLGRLGSGHPGIESVVPELRELLNDTDRNVRTEAQVALENLAGKGAPPAELKLSRPRPIRLWLGRVVIGTTLGIMVAKSPASILGDRLAGRLLVKAATCAPNWIAAINLH